MFVSSLVLAFNFSLLLGVSRAANRNLPILESLPPNARNLAHDADLDALIAYDASGNVLGRVAASQQQSLLPRQDDPGTCFTVDADDIQQLPGWSKVRDYIVNEWSDGWDEISINPSDYPDRPMELCSLEPVTPIVLDGEPECRTKMQRIGGTTENVHASLKLSSSQGTSSKTSVTVTQESTISLGSSVSVKMGLPGIGGLEASVSNSFSLTNSLSTANDFTVTGKGGQSASMKAGPGERCLLELNVTSCTAHGSGSQKMTASGWVWVNYGHKVKDHYKWATKIDDHLNADERSVSIQFRTSTSTVSRSEYLAACDPINPPVDPPVTETPPVDPPVTETPPVDPPVTETPPVDPPVTTTEAPPTTTPPPGCENVNIPTVTITETVSAVGTITIIQTVTAAPSGAAAGEL